MGGKGARGLNGLNGCMGCMGCKGSNGCKGGSSCACTACAEHARAASSTSMHFGSCRMVRCMVCVLVVGSKRLLAKQQEAALLLPWTAVADVS